MAVADDLQDDDGAGWGSKLALLGALLALAGLIYWAVSAFHSGASGPKRQTVKIAVLPDTPPPPPPPPQEKKPEPEIKEQKPQPQQEEQKPLDKAPEPEQLKMEGAAGDGPSAFSAGAVNNDYQKGEIGTGQGGGDRLQEALFGRRLQKHIQLALARDKSIKLGDYRVKVSVWLDEHGVIQRVQLDAPTGDDKIDQALRDSFARLPPISDMPAGIRQPVRLGISNRMTG